MNQIIDLIKRNLEMIFSNSFFTTLDKVEISENEWKRFFIQKYGSVGYFLEFLLNGSRLSEVQSKDLSEIFLQNYNDEVGFIQGKFEENFRHEVWRLRSLNEFGITSDQLKNAKLISSTQLHSDILATLPRGNDFLEYCGALLFLEIFVAREMRCLIKAFERTMPGHFPSGGYEGVNTPNNTHEYWYNHAEHDPYHFKAIKEGLEKFISDHEEKRLEIYSRLTRGIEKCFVAKMHLYDDALMQHMKHE